MHYFSAGSIDNFVILRLNVSCWFVLGCDGTLFHLPLCGFHREAVQVSMRFFWEYGFEHVKEIHNNKVKMCLRLGLVSCGAS